jgi:hypothetical protein
MRVHGARTSLHDPPRRRGLDGHVRAEGHVRSFQVLRMPSLNRECRKCGGWHRVTPSGHLAAHKCEHGGKCVLSYIARRRGERAVRCAACLAGRQLELPFREAMGAAR